MNTYSSYLSSMSHCTDFSGVINLSVQNIPACHPRGSGACPLPEIEFSLADRITALLAYFVLLQAMSPIASGL